MAGKLAAVSDSGPLIHLSEISALNALKIFVELEIPEEVQKETNRLKINAKLINLSEKHKDMTKFLAASYKLDFGEAEAISLCFQRGMKLFLTDDLEARTVAKQYGLEVHGTVGILVRAYKEKILSKNEALEKIRLLRTKSSLFITKDLVDWSIKQIML